MSSYSGPRRVNVSQYLRNLNVQGPSVEETFTDEDLEKDLALFTNTQFFDFETGQHTDYQAAPVKPETTTQSSPGEDVSPSDSILGDFSSAYDFPISGRSLSCFLSLFSSSPLYYACYLDLLLSFLFSWLGATIPPLPRASASEERRHVGTRDQHHGNQRRARPGQHRHAHARKGQCQRRVPVCQCVPPPEILLGAFPYHESGCRPALGF